MEMHEVECALSNNADSVRLSRSVVRRIVASCPAEFVESATLLTDELVTNAIRHGRPPIVLTIRFDAHALVIEVVDCGPGDPAPRDVDANAERGRGLKIVDHVADEWGVHRLPEGKRVWCSLLVRTPAPVRHGVSINDV
jgi:anti-sigma regulatory factor (Ser/Thr protein kinase)